MGRMSQFFRTRSLFFFNLLFSGALAGFGLALFVISCSTGVPAQAKVSAEEKSLVSGGLMELQAAFRSVPKKVLPSIVAVNTFGSVPSRNFSSQDPFEFFFGPRGFQDPRQKEEQEPDPKSSEIRPLGLGSGFVVEKKGNKVYILTNNHVIEKAKEIKVTFMDDKEFTAQLVGADPRRDLALLSIETTDPGIVPLVLGDSDQIQVGDIVMAMGNPMGLDFTVTQGIVSALGRQTDGEIPNISSFIQTDAAINQGNSGGPLVNLQGEVLGINTMIVTPSGGSVGLGFAVPINSAKKAIRDFISQGSVKYGWLGVSIGTPDRETVAALGLENRKGAFVWHLFKGSPADKGGVKPGDLVVSLNGTPLKDHNDLTVRVGEIPAGQRVELEVIRGGRSQKLQITIEERQNEQTISSQNNLLWPGVGVNNLTPDLKKYLKLADQVQGVVVANIIPDSALGVAGLKRGDVITQVQSKQIRSLADFYRELSSAQGEVKITFQRQGVELSIGITR